MNFPPLTSGLRNCWPHRRRNGGPGRDPDRRPGTAGAQLVFAPGTGIWFSIILRLLSPRSELPKLNLLAAVALSRAVKAVLGFRPLVKWPNDLYYQDRKLSGILTEVSGELGPVGICYSGGGG